MDNKNSIVGDLINFRGLVYSPLNENGVIFLFGRVADDLHMYIEEIKPGFPDCVARRYTGKGWERVRIEFEFISSNFKQHGHNPDECDIVICWEHDWKECPIEVIELKSEIREMENPPIQKPTTSNGSEVSMEKALALLFEKQGVSQQVQLYYHKIANALREWDEEIWQNVGQKYIGVHSPEKAFASFKPRPSSLRIDCFSRGDKIPETKVSNEKYAPRWVKFTVKKDSQISDAINILKESHSRIKTAIKAGETTGYYSGGEKFGLGKKKEINEGDEET